MSVAVESANARLKMRGSKKAAGRGNTADATATGRTRDVGSPGRLTGSGDVALPPEMVEQLGQALARVLMASVRREAKQQ